VGIVGGTLGIRLLNHWSPTGQGPFPEESRAYDHKSKLETLLGSRIWDEARGKTVLDFGCGPGREVVELAQHGAKYAIGIDLRQKWLKLGRQRATEAGVADRCHFATSWDEPVDLIISLDSFEHFDDPAAILVKMRSLLGPGGKVVASFGPTWLHPLGGHIYSIFPFAHLIFTERALVTWRAQFKDDRARTIRESGLNKMTISRFQRLVAESPFRFESLEAVPIRRLKRVANRLTREFTTSIVRCRLVPKDG
jgi:SAM-dependent methyltransferase